MTGRRSPNPSASSTAADQGKPCSGRSSSPWRVRLRLPLVRPERGGRRAAARSPTAGEYGDLDLAVPRRPATPSRPSPRSTASTSTWRPSPTRRSLRRRRRSSCDGVDDEREINDAIAIRPGRDRRVCSTATSAAHGRITLPEHTTLRGQGSLTTTVEITANGGGSGYLPITTGGSTSTSAGFTMRGNAFVMVTRSHVRVQDVRATCIDLDGNWHKASGNGMFFVWVAPPVDVIDDVEFYECHVVWSPHARLQHEPGLQRRQVPRHDEHPVRQLPGGRLRVRCHGDPGITGVVTARTSRARSGSPASTSTSGRTSINCEVVNCVASDNWESGLPPRARRPVRRRTARTSAPDGLEEHPLPELRQLGQRPAEHLREPLLHVRLLPLARHAPRELRIPEQPERGVLRPRRCEQLLHRTAPTTAAPTAGRSARRARTSRSPTASPRTTCGGPSGSRSPSGSRWTTSSIPTSSETGDTRTSSGGTRTRRSTSSRSRTPTSRSRPYGNGMPIINQAGSGNTYDALVRLRRIARQLPPDMADHLLLLRNPGNTRGSLSPFRNNNIRETGMLHRNSMGRRSAEDGISEVVGFVIILAVVMAALSLYLTYAVPVLGREDEIKEMDSVRAWFVDYKTGMDQLWLNSPLDARERDRIDSRPTLFNATIGQVTLRKVINPGTVEGEGLRRAVPARARPDPGLGRGLGQERGALDDPGGETAATVCPSGPTLPRPSRTPRTTTTGSSRSTTTSSAASSSGSGTGRAVPTPRT